MSLRALTIAVSTAAFLALTGCASSRPVVMSLEPDYVSSQSLPYTVRVDYREKREGYNAHVVKFEAKEALIKYVRARRTFKDVIEAGPADLRLSVKNTFKFQAPHVFEYHFTMTALLEVEGRILGQYRGYGLGKGGMTRFSAGVDDAPVNKGLKAALDELFDRIDSDSRGILARYADESLPVPSLQGGDAPRSVAAAPPPSRIKAPTADPRARTRRRIKSDVDKPKYKNKTRPQDFAVVVGVEKYSNDLPDAKFAKRDAKAVKRHLLAMGYPERNIKFLTGARATKSNLEAYLEDWLPRMAKPSSRVFFYFSGHGAPDPVSKQVYLVPVDGNPNYLKRTGYSVKKLYAGLNRLKAGSVTVVIDSCFSGAGGRSVLPEGARPLVTTMKAALPKRGKILLFAASAPNEITSTLKDQGHGLFTYYFLRGLNGSAKDSSGHVTGQGLYDYLKPLVQDAANRKNRDQTPLLQGSGKGRVIR